MTAWSIDSAADALGVEERPERPVGVREGELAAGRRGRYLLEHPERGAAALGVEEGEGGGAEERQGGARWRKWCEAIVAGLAQRHQAPDGKLAPRSDPGALLTDETACVEQALRLARSGRFATLCLHADTPGALRLVGAVRVALEREGLLRGPSGAD